MRRKLCSSLAWSPPASSVKPALACVAFSLMAVYLWFLPIGYTIAIRNLAFFSLIFLTFWAAWRQGLRLHLPLGWVWLLYAIVALASVSYAANSEYSFGEAKKEVGYAILALLLAATWVRSTASLSRLIALIVAGDLLMVSAALVKGVIINPFWNAPFPFVDSLYNGVGNFSTYLVTVIPFIMAFAYQLPREARLWRRLLYILLAGNVFALHLTSNRMGMLTLLVEILFMAGILFFQNGRFISRKSLVAGAIVIVITASSALSMMQIRGSAEGDIRWAAWHLALDNITAQPLSGGGFGREAFKLRNEEFKRQHSQLWHAHNMFLNKGVQMGIPGIFAFVWLLIAAFHAMRPTHKLAELDPAAWSYAVAGTAMVVGVIMKNMTDDFFVNDNAFLFWVLAGAVIGSLSRFRNSASPPPPPV